MKRETWIIALFAVLYIATFSWFQYQHNSVMQKAKEADAMAKLVALDQRMYRHLIATQNLGRALQEMNMIDSTQYNRMWQCIDNMRIQVWDHDVLEDALPQCILERFVNGNLTWHEIMEGNAGFN